MNAMQVDGWSEGSAAFVPSLAAIARMGSVESLSLVLLLAYAAHVLCVAGLVVRRGHPSWLGLAYGLLPGIGLAAALVLPQARSLRRQEREGLHLATAAQQSSERSMYSLRVLLIAGVGVMAVLFVARTDVRVDLTAAQRYTLDPVPQALLGEIEKYEPELRVRYFYSPQNIRPQRFATLPREMNELLSEYARHGGGRFRFQLVEVPQLTGEDEEDADTGGFGILGVDAPPENDHDDTLSDAERERRQIVREVRDLGIRPILDQVTDGGRTEQLRYYSALHVSYGPAGEEVLSSVSVTREQARAGWRAVDVANWELTLAIIRLMDRSINVSLPFQIRGFTFDDRVRLRGIDGLVAQGDVAEGTDGVRYRLITVDPVGRRIVIEPEDALADAEPREIRLLPSFRYRIGFVEGHGETHDFEGAATLRSHLETIGFDVAFVDLEGGSRPVPDDIDALVLTATANALPDRTRYEIDQFLMRGGGVLYAHAAMVLPEEPSPYGGPQEWPRTHSSWLGFATPYGLRVGSRIVFDNECLSFPTGGIFLPQAVQVRPENLTGHPVSAGIVSSEDKGSDLSRYWLYGVPVQPARANLHDEIEVREILRSSDASWLQEVTWGVLRNPFGFGDARDPSQARNPDLMRMMRPNRSSGLQSYPLAASVSGTFVSAFAGEEIPEPLMPGRAMPRDFGFPPDYDEDWEGLPEAAEHDVDDADAADDVWPAVDEPDLAADASPTADTPARARERLNRSIAESRLVVLGSNMSYPLEIPRLRTRPFIENSIFYLLPDGERLLALKAKTTAYTPIEATLTDLDRTWYTSMVTLMVPIGLLIVAVLVMVSDRAEQLFFRARQQARRRGTAAAAPLSVRQAGARQLNGGLLLGLSLLMVCVGGFGWMADIRASVLWLLAFVIALPLAGLGLEQLGSGTRGRSRDGGAASDVSEPSAGLVHGPLPFALGLVTLMIGLLILQALDTLAVYRTAMVGLAIAAGVGAVGCAAASFLAGIRNAGASVSSASSAPVAASGGDSDGDDPASDR